MPQTNNRGWPKKDLETNEQSWLLHFLDHPGITYTTPGKRDQVYIGKVTGKSCVKQRRIYCRHFMKCWILPMDVQLRAFRVKSRLQVNSEGRSHCLSCTN